MGWGSDNWIKACLPEELTRVSLQDGFLRQGQLAHLAVARGADAETPQTQTQARRDSIVCSTQPLPHRENDALHNQLNHKPDILWPHHYLAGGGACNLLNPLRGVMRIGLPPELATVVGLPHSFQDISMSIPVLSFSALQFSSGSLRVWGGS